MGGRSTLRCGRRGRGREEEGEEKLLPPDALTAPSTTAGAGAGARSLAAGVTPALRLLAQSTLSPSCFYLSR